MFSTLIILIVAPEFTCVENLPGMALSSEKTHGKMEFLERTVLSHQEETTRLGSSLKIR